MLYGAVLTVGEPQQITEDDGGEVLHLSHAVLVNPKDSTRTYLMINSGGNSICAGVLHKDKLEMVNLDLFIAVDKGTSLSIKGGKNEVHITGYFEPSMDEMPDESSESGEGSDLGDDIAESASEGAEDEIPTVKPAKQNAKGKRAKIEELTEDHDTSDDDGEGGDSESDEEQDKVATQAQEAGTDEDESEDDDDDDDEGDDESQESSEEESKMSPQVETRSSPAAQKRSAAPKAQPAKKKRKGETSTTATGGAQKYEVDLTKFLKLHGKANMAMLGSKVPKPADVVQKLGAFVKERPKMFKVDKDTVTLV